MKRKKKILTIIVLATITLIFLLPAIGFSILNWGVLPKAEKARRPAIIHFLL